MPLSQWMNRQFHESHELTLHAWRALSHAVRYDSRAYINTGTYNRTLRPGASARVDSMQLLVVIFVCRSSNAASLWVSSGSSNTFPLSAVDHTIFNYVQS